MRHRAWIVVLFLCAACSSDDNAGPLRPFEDAGSRSDAVIDAATNTQTSDATTADVAADMPAQAGRDAGVDADEPDAFDGPLDAPLDVMQRPADVVVPRTYDPDTSYALLIMLHGYSANSTQIRDFFHLTEYRDDYGFVSVIPDGTLNSVGLRFWNATPFCCDLFDQQPDDVAYISGLIEAAKQRFNIDASRIYLAGHSNGGYMSYRMACEVDGIAAIASLAGSSFVDEADCQEASNPVSVLQVHGTLDPTVAYLGSIGNYPSAPQLVERWAARNNCPNSVDGPNRDVHALLFGDETTTVVWEGCDQGSSVELWTIVGGGHIPPLTDEFSTGVLDFLFSHQEL